jgi:hypothetical protein
MTPARPMEVLKVQFEDAVAHVIRQSGYEVHPQAGVSNFRIDLGVLLPSKPGEYLLGVECDGATYHRARSARDRDRLRQEVLEGLGNAHDARTNAHEARKSALKNADFIRNFLGKESPSDVSYVLDFQRPFTALPPLCANSVHSKGNVVKLANSPMT